MSVQSDKKQRLSVYLDPGLKRRLSEFAKRREQSASLIAEAAIASFLSPDADARNEAAVVRRLDRLDRSLHRLERDVEITSETLALFIRFWLNSTVPLPEDALAAARTKGGERYDRFIASLGRRLSQGPKLHQEVSEEIEQKAD
ncbi:CopG family transcriptional regulator [Sinorhizobium meliloti]|uniref:CopG family transcriptional regulator n=1 Tax=Rhizobium meliloti TaxID=382 RepID=UPI000FD4D6A1|nr:CopG family transcriptional regulator [Sinorhizobium meliloti]RVI14548.1 CopG family transcriptional regulator [Sinorhizobium meliloti]RVN81094.1 CopG family transcriptional regulator [Sinorhizobium meliloti]RVO03129.1 CopG family transcriptional regulator [Sinorhizobium meliloti]